MEEKNVIKILDKKFEISFDEEKNELALSYEDETPLSLRFKGNLNLIVDKDFLIESHGEIDFLTFGKKICLDSLGSQIYLNSLMSKKIRYDKKNMAIRENRRLAKLAREKNMAVKDCDCDGKDADAATAIPMLFKYIESLEDRITAMESSQIRLSLEEG
jgi:hypothetical protein